MSTRAAAKVNLTLQVRGKRPDHYHEIESLVVFADFGDTLSYAPAERFSLTIDGPFAGALDQSVNLIEKAVIAYAGVMQTQPQGTFHLTKRLPVAAGVGGGSADAAAALRLLRQHSGIPETLSDLVPVAREIGADVPCCLYSRASVMTGMGEIVNPLPDFPRIPALLVNPMQPLATAPVFQALASGSVADDAVPFEPPRLQTLDNVLAYARARSNDLERPARSLLPVIGDVLSLLGELHGALLTRLSGSGPTCFALFADMGGAEEAASRLAEMRPDWWVQPVALS